MCIMEDMMAISRADLLKQLLPGLNDLFRNASEEAKQVDQIKVNDARAAKEKEFIKQAGETFRNDVKIAQIKATDLKNKELEEAIFNDRLRVVAEAGTIGGKTARVLRNDLKKKEEGDEHRSISKSS